MMNLKNFLQNRVQKYFYTDEPFQIKNSKRYDFNYERIKGLRQQLHKAFEEATLFTEKQLVFISTCARNVRPDFSPRIYYTCNPGGVGHAYVKRLFIDRDYEGAEQPDQYTFIPALVYEMKC